MTIKEFNTKYQSFLEHGNYGLDINDVGVINYLDEEFSKEIQRNPQFQYHQIKVKIGTTRVYSNSTQNKRWEETIDRILQG